MTERSEGMPDVSERTGRVRAIFGMTERSEGMAKASKSTRILLNTKQKHRLVVDS